MATAGFPGMGLPPGSPQAPPRGQPEPGQGFDMGQLAGNRAGLPSAPDPMEQNAGILNELQGANLSINEIQGTLEAIAAQFPGSAQAIREASEALDIAAEKLVDILTTVISQAQEPQVPAPRVTG